MGPRVTLKDTNHSTKSLRPVLGRTEKGLPVRPGRSVQRINYSEWVNKIRCASAVEAAAERVSATYSRSHTYTRTRVSRELQLAGGNARGLAQLWYEQKAPGTALTYMRTLCALKPEAKRDVQVVMTEARKEATVLSAKRAMAATPQDVRAVMRLSPQVAPTLLALWVTASRHADLNQITRVTGYPPTTVMLQWNRQKSDRFGQRAVTKCVCWDRPWPKEWAPYRSVLAAMKNYRQDLTVHSIRRGAVSYLSQQGHSFEEIAMLTAHTPSADPNLAVRRYADPHPAQPESKTQMEMSRKLMRSIV